MKVKWQYESLFPSTQKPGVFPFSSSVDNSGAETNTELWNRLVGIDDSELNTFKFALGTWTVFRRLNRKIQILSQIETNQLANTVLSDEEPEPKPTSAPPNYPPVGGEDNTTFSLFKSFEDLTGGETANGGDHISTQPDYYSKTITAWRLKNDRYFGTGAYNFNQGYDKVYSDTHEDYDGIFKYRNKTGYAGPQPHIYDQVSVGEATDKPRGDDDGLLGVGAWECFRRYKNTDGRNRHYLWWRPNLQSSKWDEINQRGYPSPNRQWKWEPSNSPITDYENGLTALGQWIPSNLAAFIQFATQPESQNRYVGVATTTNKSNLSDIETKDLPIYHEVGSSTYKSNSSPLEVYFSLNFSERDEEIQDAGVVKYYILEWGDEDIQLSSENVLNSEFFEIYESEEFAYDKFTVKKLMQYLSDSTVVEPSEVMGGGDRGKLHNHVYIEPGVKTIKTIVFRLDETETFILETSLVYSQIFVADPNETLQNFNIFGASDSSILPVEDKNEFIIGSIDDRSQYVRSLQVIEINDLYENTDYLEKIYSDEFLPAVSKSLYGKYAGNLDLGQSRMFTKPYDIYDFLTNDKQSIVDNDFEITQDSLPLDSSATKILINNNDCVVELTPSNLNNFDVENTALSSEKGILIGDYSLIKEQGERIRREDSMELPRLEQRKDKQAF